MEWTDFKKTPPANEQLCIFWTTGDFVKQRICVGIYKNIVYPTIQSTVFDCGCSGIPIGEVTHWMPVMQGPDDA